MNALSTRSLLDSPRERRNQIPDVPGDSPGQVTSYSAVPISTVEHLITVEKTPRSQLITKILIPVDLSTGINHTLRWTSTLADHFGAEIHLLHVTVPDQLANIINPLFANPGNAEKEKILQLNQVHEAMLQWMGKPDRLIHAHRTGKYLVEEIINYATVQQIHLIAAGIHGYHLLHTRRIQSLNRVLEETGCPILTIPKHRTDPHPEVEASIRNLLLVIDSTPEVRRVTFLALRLVRLYQGSLFVLFVNGREPLETKLQKRFELLFNGSSPDGTSGPSVFYGRGGKHLVREISIQTRRKKVDLVILSNAHPRADLASQISGHTNCPTLIL